MAVHSSKRQPCLRRSTPRDATERHVTPKCIRWHSSFATVREDQRQRYLPSIAKGELRLQAFGVTEPAAGSDTGSITTVAQRYRDGYLVNGQKVFISRALHSDLMILLARTTPIEEVDRSTDGLSIFLVDLTSRPKGP